MWTRTHDLRHRVPERLDAILGHTGGAGSSPVRLRRLLLNPKFFRNGIVMLVLVVGTAALLFTWIQSTTPTNPVGYSAFLADVQGGNVTSVVQQGDTLTVKSNKPPTNYTVTVPNVLTQVFPDMIAAAKSGSKDLPPDVYKAEPAPDTSWLGLLLTGLLPLLVIGGFIFFMMR